MMSRTRYSSSSSKHHPLSLRRRESEVPKERRAAVRQTADAAADIVAAAVARSKRSDSKEGECGQRPKSNGVDEDAIGGEGRSRGLPQPHKDVGLGGPRADRQFAHRSRAPSLPPPPPPSCVARRHAFECQRRRRRLRRRRLQSRVASRAASLSRSLVPCSQLPPVRLTARPSL